MKVPVSWLREFANVPGSPEEIGGTMSLRGFVLEGVERLPDGDAVIDFEVTANRPDCLSVRGIAREVAAAYDVALDATAAGRRSTTGSGGLDIAIESPDLCPRYAGSVADVTVKASPDWLQARLRAAGVRPINNIVDVTNYVMLELGQPMHAFDHARLGGGRIVVRVARAGETVETLDGEQRSLAPGMLVIADATRPVAVAGVMGGRDSEVTPATRTIVLESAYFNPPSVRRTSRTLELRTEASLRFERGADPSLPVEAMERACDLLERIGAGSARGSVVDCHPGRIEPTSLDLRRARIPAVLGLSIPDPDVRRILERLGFDLRDSAAGWTVTVPTRRVDVSREVDLIEEVARHYGFDRIPATFPSLVSAPAPLDARIVRARQLRTVMTGAGFSEAATFGFVAEPAAAPFAAPGDLVTITNPLSEHFAVLKPSSLPGLVAAVAHNRRREQRDVRLFEMGSSFTRGTGERQTIGLAWTGTSGDDHWGGGTREVDFFDLKGMVERLCDALQLDSQIEPHREEWLVAGRAAVVTAAGKRVGVLGQLSPVVAAAHDLPAADRVWVAEIDLDAAQTASSGSVARIVPLPRYPSVIRDISIVVPDTLAAAVVRRTITGAAPRTLVRLREFDRYQGKGVAEGSVSLSMRLTFRAADRTLTDDEVHEAMKGVLAALAREHGAVQR